MKKYVLFVLIYLFILALITSCGGGGGGGSVSFSGSNQLHNGGDAGGWGKGNQTGGGLGGGSASTISAEAGTFTPCDDIDWTTITLEITVTSDGATTTHTFDSGDKDAIAELLTSLKKGDTVSVSVEIEMQDGSENRTSSAGPVTIGVGDNHISIPTPYRFDCSMESCRNAYEDYGCTDYPSATLTSGEYSGFYTVNDAASKLPSADDIEAPGYKFDHWETIDGQPYTPGVSRGDVVISPVFKPDYSVAYTDLVDTIVITEQSEFNTLMSTQAAQNFSGKEIKLYCNVSTTTGFTNTTDGFQGIFDGQEHTVTLAITENTGSHAGLFYMLGNNADIENLTTAGNVTLTTATGTGGGVGGIAGIANGTITIKNCINRAAVSNSNELSTAGGIVGKSSFTVTIEQCANRGNIISGCCRTGGITGETGTAVTIKECYNTAQITCSGSVSTDQPKIGGIVGRNTGTVYHCYNTGAVHVNDVNSNGSGYVGGVCGVNDSGDIAYCYNTGALSSDNSDSLGAIHGFISSPTQQACCTNNPSSTHTVSNANTLFPSADSSIWVSGSGNRPRLINNPE